MVEEAQAESGENQGEESTEEAPEVVDELDISLPDDEQGDDEE